jgi:hypothetical protein
MGHIWSLEIQPAELKRILRSGDLLESQSFYPLGEASNFVKHTLLSRVHEARLRSQFYKFSTPGRNLLYAVIPTAEQQLRAAGKEAAMSEIQLFSSLAEIRFEFFDSRDVPPLN